MGLRVPSNGGGSGSSSSSTQTFAKDITFNGGGAPLFDADFIDCEVPFNCTLESITLTSAVSGTVAIDVQTTSYSDYPNSFASLIGAGTVPELTTDYKATLTDFSDWDGSTLTAGDILRILIDGNATGVEQLTVSIRATET